MLMDLVRWRKLFCVIFRCVCGVYIYICVCVCVWCVCKSDCCITNALCCMMLCGVRGGSWQLWSCPEHIFASLFYVSFLLLYILTVMCRLVHSVILCMIIFSPTAVIPLSLPSWIYLAKSHSLADCNPDKLQRCVLWLVFISLVWQLMGSYNLGDVCTGSPGAQQLWRDPNYHPGRGLWRQLQQQCQGWYHTLSS